MQHKVHVDPAGDKVSVGGLEKMVTRLGSHFILSTAMEAEVILAWTVDAAMQFAIDPNKQIILLGERVPLEVPKNVHFLHYQAATLDAFMRVLLDCVKEPYNK